jgi:hypothetical protein
MKKFVEALINDQHTTFHNQSYLEWLMIDTHLTKRWNMLSQDDRYSSR